MGLSDLEFYSELPVSQHSTLEDLVDKYGKEAVKRGIMYMDSLSDAEENFKDSADNGDEYADRFTEAYTGEADGSEDLSERWSEAMEEGGLGLDE